MPPYPTGTVRQPSPVPRRHTTKPASRPAGPADQYAATAPEQIAPPPLPQQRQSQPQEPRAQSPRLQPWPLQAATEKRSGPHQPVATDETLQAVAADAGRSSPPQPQRRYSSIAHLLVGFVAGAAFWHAVGFWTLVHDLVFSGPRLTASDGAPLPVLTATPAAKVPPRLAFDEETLRGHATRPAMAGARPEMSNITTGSIRAPAPAEAYRPVQLPPSGNQRAARAEGRESEDSPVMMGPGGISWTPAVSRSR